jgi:hypothetical protein
MVDLPKMVVIQSYVSLLDFMIFHGKSQENMDIHG